MGIERVVEIKKGSQGEIIQYLISELECKNNVDKTIEQTICGGICYMLSLEWLHAVARNAPGWQDQYGTRKHAQNNLAYYKQIADNFFAYCKTKELGLDEVLHSDAFFLYDKELYPLATRNLLTVDDTKLPEVDNPVQLSTCLLDKGEYLTIRLVLKKGAHRVAAYYDKHNHIFYFYDPNAGVTKIFAEGHETLEEEVDKFITAWWNCYEINPIQFASVRIVKKEEKK